MRPYKAPAVLFNRHLETIYPSLMRRVELPSPVRERITTPDDDFLDLDWFGKDSQKCVIISHGLEGNSSRAYVTGMVRALRTAGYDIIAWNYRGCSGEINRQRRFYHSGATDDLQTVVGHVAKKYNHISLIGFSLGGNITLKYLGEPNVPAAVRKGVVFSVPIDLHHSCIELSRPHNWIYSQRFLRSLKEKVRLKAAVRQDLDIRGIDSIKDLMTFDDVFTGPIHGFRNAIDYYTQCSALHFLPNIKVPTLLVNALNDPFLSPECYPKEKPSPDLTMEFPERGGHVGFTLFDGKGLYWSEIRALAFIES